MCNAYAVPFICVGMGGGEVLKTPIFFFGTEPNGC